MRRLPAAAQAFIALTVLAGLAAAILAVRDSLSLPGRDPYLILLFALLVLAASTSQLYSVTITQKQRFSVALAFIFVGVIALDYGLLTALVLATFVPEWVSERRALHIQAFNIANFLLGALAGAVCYQWVLSAGQAAWLPVLGVVAAVALFIGINYTLNAVALRMGRGLCLRDSGILELESLVIDAGLAIYGACMGLLWLQSPWLLLLALFPLVLLYRSLEIPGLRLAAISDPKTGLYNLGHFATELRREMRRCARAGRPLSVIMADLDHLKAVNDRYGHVAGDVVITGIADAIRQETRAYDLAARFGGEEYAVMLPFASAGEARLVAERIRERVAATPYSAPNVRARIRVTLSIGVATFPEHTDSVEGLIHEADVALAKAKRDGRNRVQLAELGGHRHDALENPLQHPLQHPPEAH